MKTVFMGTPDFALEALKALHSKHDVVCVYTQPPRPSGRGHKLTPSPVQQYAEEHNIPVRCPPTFKPQEEKDAFTALNADIAVVAAYGLILPKACLNAFKYGCINIHGSLLPRWRGAAPIQRAIMAGDKETGVTLMQMDAGMDTGDMLLTKKIPIGKKDTSGSVFDKMAVLGGEVLLEGLELLEQGSLIAQKQPQNGVTHAAKVAKEEGLLSFDLPAAELDCKIRGLLPWPGAWFYHNGERISVLDADPVELNGSFTPGTVCENLTIACGSGGLKLNILRRDGKKALPAEEFLRGFDLPEGTVLNAAL